MITRFASKRVRGAGVRGEVLLLGALVQVDTLQRGACDPFRAVEHGVQGCFPDEVGQAADHAARAVVQVGTEFEQGARPVRVQP